MKIKTSIIIAGVMSLVTLVVISAIPLLRVQGNKDFKSLEVPVVISPLDPTLINIQCETVFSSKADTLNTFSCSLVNRASVAIRAVGANFTLVADVDGLERTDSILHVAEAYVHPDISRQIAPGKTLFLSPSSPMSVFNGNIKRLEIEIIYVEFADGNTIGGSEKAVEKIADIRRGAAEYRDWIRDEYLIKGRSEEALVPLLDKKSMFGPAGDRNFNSKAGERYYKRFLLEKYQENGAGSIQAILDR